MTPGDAAQLVQSLLPHASADEARELARLCGDLPLPIRLIGGVLRRKPNLTIAAMIKKLEKYTPPPSFLPRPHLHQPPAPPCNPQPQPHTHAATTCS
jgi:hypothetical protein